MHLFATGIALGSILLSTQALADPPKLKDYRAAYDECLKASTDAGPTGAVEGCTEFVVDETKREINALYNVIHAQLESKSPDDAAEFDKAQRSWLAYRNAHCDLAGKYIGSPEFVVCPMNLDIERVHELRQIAGQG
ncbi:DUF1311 domain-containing protein [Dyella halodurans]|uniref:Lysozyme inhibitor LprI family protein n=1 Tax=Dyella halodurans TaxID=1920171 RepID=A0ABV9C0A5_9GAMM|nr:lysozyme inhibitor LprI family protein [Dyella halodurans]